MAKSKFKINISITVKIDGNRKSYDLSQHYEGDPKKLDIAVMIDGWFVENNIDKSNLDSLNVIVYNDCDSDMLPSW